MRKNVTIGGDTSPGKGGRILPLAFFMNSLDNWFANLPFFHDCRPSHGDQCQITHCIWLMKKEFVNQKDDSTNLRQRLVWKGQDCSDISF